MTAWAVLMVALAALVAPAPAGAAPEGRITWGGHTMLGPTYFDPVETPDPGRVRFRLKQPWPDFMTYYGTITTGAGWIVPRKYVEKVGEDGYKKLPVGAGPYRFVSFTPGVELVLEAFSPYWRKTPSV